MAEFHQHPDGHVYVRTDTGTYADSRDNFIKDFGVEPPRGPEGTEDHIYTQGVRHAFMGKGNVIAGGDMPWMEGDQIIKRVADGLAKQKVRREAEQKVQETAARKAFSDAEAKLPYDQRRARAYPAIGDQLDALWKGGQAQTDMAAKLAAVKAKFPKPTS